MEGSIKILADKYLEQLNSNTELKRKYDVLKKEFDALEKFHLASQKINQEKLKDATFLIQQLAECDDADAEISRRKIPCDYIDEMQSQSCGNQAVTAISRPAILVCEKHYHIWTESCEKANKMADAKVHPVKKRIKL